MRLDVYHTSYFGEVREMLQDHINYAPEYAGTESNMEDIRFFENYYLNDVDRSSAYVLIDDDQKIASFMTCEKNAVSVLQDWYITNLFVRHNSDEENIARLTVELFSNKLSENSSLCINVHPVHKAILEFWQKAKYEISIANAIFLNADNEHIVSLSYGWET